ncbi:hypothetical protein F442_19877, partial [Phytophthora nicotianae P10297]
MGTILSSVPPWARLRTFASYLRRSRRHFTSEVCEVLGNRGGSTRMLSARRRSRCRLQ